MIPSSTITLSKLGDAELISLLLGAGADVSRKDNRDNVALHHAAMRGDVEVIKALVEAGSDVDAQNRQGWTPLMNACYWCKPDAAACFIELGETICFFAVGVHLNDQLSFAT